MSNKIIPEEKLRLFLIGLRQAQDKSLVNLGELKECLYTIDLAMIQIKHAVTRLNEIIDEEVIPIAPNTD